MPSMIINGKKVKLKLEKGSFDNGEVSVRAVEVDGNANSCGWLIRFHADGTFSRESGVSQSFGFQYEDGLDQIKERK